MSEQSLSDVFYPTQDVETTADSDAGTTVESETVETVDSVNLEAVDTDAGESSADVDAASEVSNADDSAEGALFYQIGDEEISETEVKSWREGNMRQADYTKKTQEMAESRKELEAEKTKVYEQSTAISEKIEALEASFKEEQEAIDWEHLREYDTAEYLRLKEVQKAKQESLDSAREVSQKLKDDERNERLVGEQEKLLDLLPDWTDPATGEQARADDGKLINDYVSANNFGDGEFEKLESASVMVAILKAAKFDALQKDGEVTEKIVRKAPKVQKPSKVKQTKPMSAAEAFYGTK